MQRKRPLETAAVSISARQNESGEIAVTRIETVVIDIILVVILILILVLVCISLRLIVGALALAVATAALSDIVETGIAGELMIEVKQGPAVGQDIVTGPFKVLRQVKEGDRVIIEKGDKDKGKGEKKAA